MKRMSVGVALKNRYWVVRHGKSIPNERGLIVSSIQNGILSQFQLAPDGVNQAQRAANSFQKVPPTLLSFT
jgi:broad specificity phosphatase PhoE